MVGTDCRAQRAIMHSLRCVRLAPVLFVLLCAACIDSESVFNTLPRFQDPPDASQGFLGYTDSQTGQTLCGNCHIGQQAGWEATNHAHAWTSLQESGHAAASCEPCHTVGALGNGVTTESVGWDATNDIRYVDVQCESCHGPGLEHITNPDASQPLASIVVGVDLSSGCGECHTGTHQPFVEEWAQSGHGDMNPFPQTRAACVQCHEARGVYRAWGINADFAEKNESEPIPITCPVCHDPHDATNTRQLRFPIDEPNQDTNLCMKCHQRGGVPDAATGSRPHSPQGPLLLGTAGWRPPEFIFETDTIVATHGTAANPRLCATCHVNRMEVTDLETGEFVFDASGHLFQATPCLDSQGIPTTQPDCDTADRTFSACATSGCHADANVARSAYQAARQRTDTRLATLDNLLGQVPVSEFDGTDNKLTTGEGAKFNFDLAALRGSAIHNPFLIEALLDASIVEVQNVYGVTPRPHLPKPSSRNSR